MVNLTLQNEGVHSFESQGTNHPTTWCQIPENRSFQLYCCGNFDIQRTVHRDI